MMYGCSFHFAITKPLTKPMQAPMTITSSTTSSRFCGTPSAMKRPFAPAFCSRIAATNAVRPATRPPVKSVPARTIQPATPSAIGRRAAVTETMFTSEGTPKNCGR